MSHLIGAGLGVGMAYALPLSRLSIAEVPLVAGDGVALRGGRCAIELCCRALAYCGIGEVAGRQVIYGNGLSDLAGAMTSSRHSEGGLIGTRVGIGVGGVGTLSCLSVAEVPVVTVDLLSRRVGGGGAGEGSGIADADRSEVEVGGGHGVDDYFCGGAVGGATY